MLDDKGIEHEVCEFCNSVLEGKTRIRMLEAGCGSASHVKFRPVADAVGIDISSEQLARNKVVQEKILGDIQDYPLPKNEFDVVVCWWVMEHLAKPKDALLNMFNSLKPGGLLVLAFPNLLSYKGMATKFTPFFLHRMYYHAMKWKSHHPFPTYLRTAILPKNVIRFAGENGFSSIYFRLEEGDTLIKRIRTGSRLVNLTISAVTSAMQTISFGKLDSLMLDYCVMVLRKQRRRS